MRDLVRENITPRQSAWLWEIADDTDNDQTVRWQALWMRRFGTKRQISIFIQETTGR